MSARHQHDPFVSMIKGEADTYAKKWAMRVKKEFIDAHKAGKRKTHLQYANELRKVLGPAARVMTYDDFRTEDGTWDEKKLKSYGSKPPGNKGKTHADALTYRNKNQRHTWVYFNGRHYDVSNPHGQRNLFDLQHNSVKKRLKEGFFRNVKTRIGKSLPDRMRKGIAASYIAGRSVNTAQRGFPETAKRMRRKAIGYLAGKGKLAEDLILEKTEINLPERIKEIKNQYRAGVITLKQRNKIIRSLNNKYGEKAPKEKRLGRKAEPSERKTHSKIEKEALFKNKGKQKVPRLRLPERDSAMGNMVHIGSHDAESMNVSFHRMPKFRSCQVSRVVVDIPKAVLPKLDKAQSMKIVKKLIGAIKSYAKRKSIDVIMLDDADHVDPVHRQIFIWLHDELVGSGWSSHKIAHYMALSEKRAALAMLKSEMNGITNATDGMKLDETFKRRLAAAIIAAHTVNAPAALAQSYASMQGQYGHGHYETYKNKDKEEENRKILRLPFEKAKKAMEFRKANPDYNKKNPHLE